MRFSLRSRSPSAITETEVRPQAEAVAPTKPSVPDVRQGNTEILDAIEADVLNAIGGVGTSIAAARAEVEQMQAGLVGIRGQMDALARAAGAASSASGGLTETTGLLSATTSRIAGAMTDAGAHLDDAGARGAEARTLVAALA